MAIISSLWTWNVTDILPRIMPNLGAENNWMLYALGALVLGILIGRLVKGAAKLVLGVVMLSGFVILALLLMQRQDILSMIAIERFSKFNLINMERKGVGGSYFITLNTPRDVLFEIS